MQYLVMMQNIYYQIFQKVRKITNIQDFVPVDAGALDKPRGVVAKLGESLRRILQRAGDIHLGLHHVSREVHQGDVERKLLDIDTDEVAGLAVQPVHRGRTPFTRLQLPVAEDVAFLAHLPDDFRYGRDAEV